MKEIIVHIGSPKTGTSYLQSLFGTNVKSLCSNQINYPDINQQGHNLDYKEVDWEPTKNGFLLLIIIIFLQSLIIFRYILKKDF